MSFESFSWKLYWNFQSKIVPTLKYSQTIYEGVLFNTVAKDEIWLDLGCGHNLLPAWRSEHERKLIIKPKFIAGLDYNYKSLQKHSSIENLIRGDISKLPFKDSTFSLITANMVFEHLENPLSQLSEIYRILKPGGCLIFHTPNLLGHCLFFTFLIPKKLKYKIVYWLEKRKEDDVFPTYYRINTEKSIRNLGLKVGFKIKEIKMIVTSPITVRIPIISAIELFLIRILMKPFFRSFRSNIIAFLVKL